MIIIKVNMYLRPRDVERLRKDILSQKEAGVIVLPGYCEVLVADDETEIIVEDKTLPPNYP